MDAIDAISAMRSKLDELERSLKPAHAVDPFPKDGLHQTLHSTFKERPIFAKGKAVQLPKGATPPGLDDPEFQWRAGLLNATLGGGLKAAAWRPDKPYPGFSTIPVNKEAQSYPNQDAIDLTGVDPILSDGESLILTASRMTPEYRSQAPAGSTAEYVSGAFISYPYSQCYGIFEWEVQIPQGRGLWSAGWLMPANMARLPEQDVFEILGHDIGAAHTTVHFAGAGGKKTAAHQANAVRNLSQGFHTFSYYWSRERLKWAVDGEILFDVPTPSDLIDNPAYLITNLAVGGEGSWPGPPNELTQFPAQMKIRSIKAWAL
jgi:hypothetical protein